MRSDSGSLRFAGLNKPVGCSFSTLSWSDMEPDGFSDFLEAVFGGKLVGDRVLPSTHEKCECPQSRLGPLLRRIGAAERVADNDVLPADKMRRREKTFGHGVAGGVAFQQDRR